MSGVTSDYGRNTVALVHSSSESEMQNFENLTFEDLKVVTSRTLQYVVNSQVALESRLSDIEAENDDLNDRVNSLRNNNERLREELQQLKEMTAPLREKEFQQVITDMINSNSSSKTDAIACTAIGGGTGVVAASLTATAPFTIGMTFVEEAVTHVWGVLDPMIKEKETDPPSDESETEYFYDDDAGDGDGTI